MISFRFVFIFYFLLLWNLRFDDTNFQNFWRLLQIDNCLQLVHIAMIFIVGLKMQPINWGEEAAQNKKIGPTSPVICFELIRLYNTIQFARYLFVSKELIGCLHCFSYFTVNMARDDRLVLCHCSNFHFLGIEYHYYLYVIVIRIFSIAKNDCSSYVRQSSNDILYRWYWFVFYSRFH